MRRNKQICQDGKVFAGCPIGLKHAGGVVLASVQNCGDLRVQRSLRAEGEVQPGKGECGDHSHREGATGTQSLMAHAVLPAPVGTVQRWHCAWEMGPLGCVNTPLLRCKDWKLPPCCSLSLLPGKTTAASAAGAAAGAVHLWSGPRSHSANWC